MSQEFLLSIQFGTFVQAVYPGGLLQFKLDGGNACISPMPEPEIILSHPKLPEGFEEQIEQFETVTGCSVTLVQPFTFDPDALGKILTEASNKAGVNIQIGALDINSTYLLLLIPEEMPKEALDKFIEVLSRSSLPRIYVHVLNEEIIQIDPKPQAVLLSEPQRETSINNDDILNLRIALENAQSIDDILNSI